MSKLQVVNRYWVTPNWVLNSKEISFKAKWLFWYIQSKPHNRSFSAERIAKQSWEWKTSVTSWLKELEKNWYLVRKAKKRDNGEWDWYIYTLSEYPLDGNLTTDNIVPLSKKDNSNKDNSNKEPEEALEKESTNDLLVKYVETRNHFKEGVNNKWLKIKLLKTCKKINEDIKIARKKATKKYSIEDIEYWTTEYIKEIKSRSLKENGNKDDYYYHRFSLYLFLTRAWWLKKFINN